MRVRTMVAGITLAAFIAVLGAPAAYAAPDDDANPPGQSENQGPDGDAGDEQDDTAPPAEESADPPAEKAVVPPPPVKPTASISLNPRSVLPGATFVATTGCGVEGATASLAAAPAGISFDKATGRVDGNARPGAYVITLTCDNGGETDVDTAELQVEEAAPKPPEVDASLSVNPDERKPGERFTVDFTCPPGGGLTTLTAKPGVLDFDDDLRGGEVDENAPSGDVELTLTCPNNDKATDRLKVVDGKNAYLDLDPNDGYRDDKIEVEAYCPGTADAKLNSPVLDDITLTRDGDNILRGKTRVEDDAEYGDSFGEVLCAGGERPKDAFYVLEHRRPDLDLDLAFGKRGDDVRVYVICDFTVGTLESDVLGDIEVKRDDDDPPWRYRGTTEVVSDAKDGEHTVRIRCGDDILEEQFFVYSDGDAKGGTQVTVYPKGAPQTGGGPVGGPAGALGPAGMTGFATVPARRVQR